MATKKNDSNIVEETVPMDSMPDVQEETINEASSPEEPNVPINEEVIQEGNTEIVEDEPANEEVYNPEDFYDPNKEVETSSSSLEGETSAPENLEPEDNAPLPKAIPEDEDPNKEPNTQPIRTSTPAKIGLVNRTNKAVIVYLRKDSFMLGPSGRTGIDYERNEIKSVNHLTLNQAVAKGLVAILR